MGDFLFPTVREVVKLETSSYKNDKKRRLITFCGHHATPTNAASYSFLALHLILSHASLYTSFRKVLRKQRDRN
ncbi:uncharacterized protein G2W53_020192 [Senna tora]|uniref:Uncharacterized protein n=1 Tax=Senna tora TaxID=362788 RepID=A0A834TVH6_9FABA|nr:uncharacterized protein G2W53_020192 [Senna tora]